MEIIINIKDEKEDRILAAFDYTEDKGGRKAFLKEKIHNLIKSKVAMSELSKIEPPPTPIIDVSNLDLA